MPSPTPENSKLYEKAKAKFAHMKHSAYKMMHVVREYKRLGGTYKGKKNEKEGLSRWQKEHWTNDQHKIGYQHKDNVYRPTVRISKKTPLTFDELTKKEIAQAKQEKKKTGRVNRFRGGEQLDWIALLKSVERAKYFHGGAKDTQFRHFINYCIEKGI